MTRFARLAGYSSLLFIVLAASLNLRSGETIRPLQVEQVHVAETWIGRRTANEALTWVILSQDGLKRINVESGEQVAHVLEAHRSPGFFGARLISPDGTQFAFAHDDRQRMTFARVADGREICQANAIDLFGERQQIWPGHTYFSEDGTYCICVYSIGRVGYLARIDIAPKPHIVAKHEFIRIGQSLAVGADGTGLVLSIPTDKSPSGEMFFQVFDRELHLQHKQPVPQGWHLRAVVTPPDDENPLALLTEPQGNHWQVIRRTTENWVTLCSGRHAPQRGFYGIPAAAISPDGKWMVTSPFSPRPTLGIWSLPNGTLKREVYLEGGVHPRPIIDRTITHMRFSKSGEYLSASDQQNAYLLLFSDLVEEESSY